MDLEYVDLGLPSGLLWAKYNVGADSETEHGNYYKYGYGSTVYSRDDKYYEGSERPLASSADTATQVMGDDWRMPTIEECQELIDYTNYECIKINGVIGGKFTSKIYTNKYIFIPFGGYHVSGKFYDEGTMGEFWTSTPTRFLGYSYFFHCDASKAKIVERGTDQYNRLYASNIRGVRKTIQVLPYGEVSKLKRIYMTLNENTNLETECEKNYNMITCTLKNKYYNILLDKLIECNKKDNFITISFNIDDLSDKSKEDLMSWVREYSEFVVGKKHNIEAEIINANIYENDSIIVSENVLCHNLEMQHNETNKIKLVLKIIGV